MTSRTIILICSLVVNVCLLSYIIATKTDEGAIGRHKATGDNIGVSHTTSPKGDLAQPVLQEGKWNDIYFIEARALKARLETEGFPAFAIRALVAAAVDQYFLAKQRKLLPAKVIPQEYWKNLLITPPVGEEVRQAMRNLDREKARVLQELLGSDYRTRDTDEEAVAYRKRRYGDLSSEQIVELERINANHSAQVARLHDESMGILLAADYEKLDALEKEKRTAMEQLLGSGGLLDYDLRNSPSAAAVLRRLGQFDATEAEFRAMCWNITEEGG